ncbi:hypothetical protein CEXT_457341 [Caerostris extrusa]|uniref:Uncharacterized protein n=1 Tax=Caerostris extrusa TaxID=172846 RepID=A0AAV4XLF2_CAEEX|nr:hypothetical protein CEXT_457341 [Caerostris extrusa]
MALSLHTGSWGNILDYYLLIIIYIRSLVFTSCRRVMTEQMDYAHAEGADPFQPPKATAGRSLNTLIAVHTLTTGKVNNQ